MKYSLVRKNLSVLLVLILTVTALTAFPFGAAADPAEGLLLGDVDADGRIMARDARAILRCSARLEVLSNEPIADIDGDGTITARDARPVLRMSAKLEPTILFTERAESPSDAMMAAAATYPAYPRAPIQDDYDNLNDYYTAHRAWSDETRRLRTLENGRRISYDNFFRDSICVLTADNEDKNFVFSPLSAFLALGMTAEVTGAETRRQILHALNETDLAGLRADARALWQSVYRDDGRLKCLLADSIWLNDRISYDPDVLDTVAANYYASSFRGDPRDEAYNARLQAWLNEQTDDLLADAVKSIRFPEHLIITLASTVYYSGRWVDPFSAAATTEDVFHKVNGDVLCDFMRSETAMSYWWSDSFSAISLPLTDGSSMKLLLPDEGIRPEALFADAQAVDFLLTGGAHTEERVVKVALSLPKFDVYSKTDLVKELPKLGITDVFDPNRADFSPLVPYATDPIAVTSAEQDARVLVDEDGCRAAAITVITAAGSAMPPNERVEFRLDRPFVFEIMSASGLPLFVGVVNRPA